MDIHRAGVWHHGLLRLELTLANMNLAAGFKHVQISIHLKMEKREDDPNRFWYFQAVETIKKSSLFIHFQGYFAKVQSFNFSKRLVQPHSTTSSVEAQSGPPKSPLIFQNFMDATAWVLGNEGIIQRWPSGLVNLARSLGCFRANLQENMVFLPSKFGFSCRAVKPVWW